MYHICVLLVIEFCKGINYFRMLSPPLYPIFIHICCVSEDMQLAISWNLTHSQNIPVYITSHNAFLPPLTNLHKLCKKKKIYPKRLKMVLFCGKML